MPRRLRRPKEGSFYATTAPQRLQTNVRLEGAADIDRSTMAAGGAKVYPDPELAKRRPNMLTSASTTVNFRILLA
jgi:hypothetical protein